MAVGVQGREGGREVSQEHHLRGNTYNIIDDTVVVEDQWSTRPGLALGAELLGTRAQLGLLLDASLAAARAAGAVLVCAVAIYSHNHEA